MAKISVIVPVYGVEKYLKECVDSILKQTLDDLEILLIDDGSKDGCPKMIDEYAQKDNRVIAIHKPNGGYGQTCNVGLEKASGEYIAILEPDDYIENNMYEELYKIAKENDSDIVKSAYYDNLQSPAEQRVTKMGFKNAPEGTITLKDYPQILSYHPSIWSCIYKREFLNRNNIRFVEAPGAGWTDNPFQVATLCLANRINITNKAYYYWRKVENTESERLKDYTIPFKRSDEIHEWLDEHNISDEGILACLYMRELGYIKLVLEILELKNFLDGHKRIKAMLGRMDKNIIENSSVVEPWAKKFYYKISKNVLGYCFRKIVISIHLNKNSKQIKILGKTIIGGKSE